MSVRPLVLCLALAACGDDPINPTSPCDPTEGTIVRAVDGDTADLEAPDGKRYDLRYLLVDTPELDDSECFSAEARQWNDLLAVGQEVRLEYDGDDCTDMFDRQLVYVWIGDHMLNRVFLERGYGRYFAPAKDTPYVYGAELQAAAAAAESSRAGLWGVCE